jgi:hypothetical protein
MSQFKHVAGDSLSDMVVQLDSPILTYAEMNRKPFEAEKIAIASTKRFKEHDYGSRQGQEPKANNTIKAYDTAVV